MVLHYFLCGREVWNNAFLFHENTELKRVLASPCFLCPTSQLKEKALSQKKVEIPQVMEHSKILGQLHPTMLKSHIPQKESVLRINAKETLCYFLGRRYRGVGGRGRNMSDSYPESMKKPLSLRERE